METKAGERVEADLFIDATGAEAALIGRLPGSDFESWRRWAPCDRMLAGTAPRLEAIPGFSQISAFRSGWIGLYPLQHRTAVTAVYDSSQITDAEIADALPVLTGAKLQGEAFVSAIEPGLRPRAWIGNCVAVGDAADVAASEPLDAMPQPHLDSDRASVAVDLSCSRATPTTWARLPPSTRRSALNARNIRDFQITHYKLNQRRDDPFWNRARATWRS